MRLKMSWKKRAKIKRVAAGTLAGILFLSSTTFPVKASDVWPQKSTAPFYCIDGGKGWQTVDRYDNYKYDTLPSPLSETQAKRLFWAYPDNWNNKLKPAAQKYDPELYRQIASVKSDANIVKRIKDDAATKFAWVADNPEIEARAVDAVLKLTAETSPQGKAAPEAIREATSEEKAVPFTVLPFSDGPAALDTEFKLSSEFVRDIAKIEPQSVWDNGSTGGNVGWLDASQDKNIAKSVLGENLYEVTWGGDSVKIHNNGSAVANENAVGSEMSDEEKYNKTMVRFKITMKGGSGWTTEGEWNDNYLIDWMNFKACINAPDHQRLYQAGIPITPSDLTFYLVLSQDGTPTPPYGPPKPSVDFQVFQHEETFKSNYNVRLKKMDAETGKPLMGSQFYLYERFDGEGELSDSQTDAGMIKENLSFAPWDGFQIFTEGTTNDSGVVAHKDSRSYEYEKTYCNGHGAPKWAEIPEEEADEITGDIKNSSVIEETKDRNRAAAQVWLDLVASCEEEANISDMHYHWLSDDSLAESIGGVLTSGEPAGEGGGADKEEAFVRSGCEADCEETYEKFINLKFTYTWKEIQARTGYILHGVHAEDLPIEMVTTNSSQAGAKSTFAGGYSADLTENKWYAGGGGGRAAKARRSLDAKKELYDGESLEPGELKALAETVLSKSPKVAEGIQSFSKDIFRLKSAMLASDSDATMIFGVETASDAVKSFSLGGLSDTVGPSDTVSPSNATNRRLLSAPFAPRAPRTPTEDDNWDDGGSEAEFQSYLDQAERDGIDHLDLGDSDTYSHCNGKDPCGDSWQAFDRRTEGRIHINKRDLDLYRKENEKYTSYGDTEGDGTLEGAIYGLFAAEDILHPDSLVGADGTVKNTGTVYRRNDLTAVATTDKNGNTDFLAYTEQPGMIFNYGSGAIEKREDIDWDGPGNLYQNTGFQAEINDYTGDNENVRRYQNNEELNGNCWIGRPLILGKYYVKELSRSEGYELSVNGIMQKHTNLGAGFDTPAAIASAHGTAVLSMPELSAAMEGDDGGGNGYDQLPFSVTSAGTVDAAIGSDGYDIIVSGFPEGTEFYRVDTGEEEVTGPHVTGTEDVIVKDEHGNPVWERAESDSSNVKYRPVYGGNGEIVGQEPMSREEPQILKAEQVPEMKAMQVQKTDFDMNDPFYQEEVKDYDLSNVQDQAFLFMKAKVEETLQNNGYDVPKRADGSGSTIDAPVFGRGVRKGEPDLYGQTTTVGDPAISTVYGAAIAELKLENPADSTTVLELITTVLAWYNDHPEWSLGGIDKIEKIANGYTVTLYAAASSRSSRRFFTTREEGGKLAVNKVYAVLENPHDLRWVYQEYSESGDYAFEVTKQYFQGSGSSKRYYIDVVLKPAMLVNAEGNLQEILHTAMVYHKRGEELVDYLDGDPAHGYRVALTERRDKVEITTEPEQVETDVPLNVAYDKVARTYTVHVKASGTDHYGAAFTDESGSLKLNFLMKTAQKKAVLSTEDIAALGAANVLEYRTGDEIGYAQYLMLFGGASVSASVSAGAGADDTYIVAKRLVYRGQNKVSEDGGTGKAPVQVLERPVKQKVKVVKDIAVDGNGHYANNTGNIHEDAFTSDFGGFRDAAAARGIANFRFKLYLKSNLERLWKNGAGEIFWQDRNGNPVEIPEYRKNYPELVQKIYTEKDEAGGTVRLLETVTATVEDGAGKTREVERYNYEKFFDAVKTAGADRWYASGLPLNSSFKPLAKSNLTGIENEINTSAEAKENAKRSDAVRQFAIDWYLDEEIAAFTHSSPAGDGLEADGGSVKYTDELYDKALYAAILKAEDYLKPFFSYDLDSIYAIAWDSAADGGIDKDFATLGADELYREDGTVRYSYGISKDLPYGDYVLVEQQPWNPAWNDFANKHYAIDKPKELSLPAAYEGGFAGAQETPEKENAFYRYSVNDRPEDLARKYLIRFNEEMAENHTDDPRAYVVKAHGHDGDFEIYKYGLDRGQTAGHYEPYKNSAVAAYYHYDSASENAGTADDVQYFGGASDLENQAGMYWKDGVPTATGVRTAYDGKYAPMLVPWSMTEPENEAADCTQNVDGTSSYVGYAYRKLRNTFYAAKLRVEKLDAETGEPVFHDDGIFALYAAERDDAENGDGVVKRYERETVITGSKLFLEAMGARQITPLEKNRENTWDSGESAGATYYGIVPPGTPICIEKEGVLLTDQAGRQTGIFAGFSTARDGEAAKADGTGTETALQTVGYLEAPQPVGAGVYVLAELKAPKGYVRSKPIPVEVYSDEVSYYLDGGREKTVASVFSYPVRAGGNKPEDSVDTARIFVNDAAARLEVSKVKTEDSLRWMKVSGRVEGTLTELTEKYGAENLELAYNSSGKYLGFGWKRGTLEYLETRKAAGESVEPVYGDGAFQGYGYVTRKLETGDDKNRFTAGAKLALYDALEVRPSGDREDYAFEGVKVTRDRNGNVTDITVQEGYAGSQTEFLQKEGVWAARTVNRADTAVLFYDLGNLKVFRTDRDGDRIGYDRDGKEQRVTFDTKSVYAVRGNTPVFEISGGDFSQLTYDANAGAFTAVDKDTVIYHLDSDGCRDAEVDGYTGLAYVMRSGSGPLGQAEGHYFLWPVKVSTDAYGNVIAREKILTGRPAEIHADEKDAYVTGTWDSGGKEFVKSLNPVYDIHGLVGYCQKSGAAYEKGEPIYDRDGDYVRYRYSDLLESYNRAAYEILEHRDLKEIGDPKDAGDDLPLWRRQGEAFLIPNIWISGEERPNDPTDKSMTGGQADMLKRVYPGVYILEELSAPEGYVRALPEAVRIREEVSAQKVTLENERTKAEILKVNGTDRYRTAVLDYDNLEEPQNRNVEGKGAYTNQSVIGAQLALYRAKRVYTSDYATFPLGYYLVKTEETPARWETEDHTDNHPVPVTACWITDGKAKYFEGIPAGDYILEELSAPDGYLRSRMELTVEETEELQSFVLKDDHTKLEIFKYEAGTGGQKKPLHNRSRAELTLYPAVTDGNGRPILDDGVPRYDGTRPVDAWMTDDLTKYRPTLTEAYEKMFAEYGDGFREFSWQLPDEKMRRAELLESASTGRGETVTQLWRLDSGKQVRITACRTLPTAREDAFGNPETTFEYQFNYRSLAGEPENSGAPGNSGARGSAEVRKNTGAVSYDTAAGRHRIDRIPVGQYVLVETVTPAGYRTAKPKCITVKETGALQKYEMKNEAMELFINKVDGEGRQLSGAGLALYQSDPSGELNLSGEFLVDRWVSGEEGIYTADDLAEGTVPAGCRPGDRRLHRISPIACGSYYLVEETCPEYYVQMEPQKFTVTADGPVVVCAENRPARGQIVIEKQDASWEGKKLPGAKFEVTNPATGERFFMVTGEEGKAVSPLLPVGTADANGTIVPYEYRIREVQAPEYYRVNLSEKVIRFANGNREVLTYEMTVADEETELIVSKSDFETGLFVEGALLSVYRARMEGGVWTEEGEPADTWVSDGKPHRIIGKLAAGCSYILREESTPEGYALSAPVVFTVSADGRKLLDIANERSRIDVSYRDGTDTIEAVTVTGRVGIKVISALLKDGKEILSWPAAGNGRTLTEKEVADGEVYTLLERTCFTDGNTVLTRKETFRIHLDRAGTQLIPDRVCEGTVLTVAGEDGAEIGHWVADAGNGRHRIENRKSADSSDSLFTPGGTYRLEEVSRFSDGSSQVTDRMTFLLNREGAVIHADMTDRPTHVVIQKTDITTGEELPGAHLTISDAAGKVVDEWVSEDAPHEIIGGLTAGESYTLREEGAPDGYGYAQEITFTVDEGGGIERVRMEDCPTDVIIRKTDIATGRELPGAHLILRDKSGKTIEEWMSGEMPHEIVGKLIAGERYTLHEEGTPDGYAFTSDVTFSVSRDGSADRVLMEDRPTRAVIRKTDVRREKSCLGPI